MYTVTREVTSRTSERQAGYGSGDRLEVDEDADEEWNRATPNGGGYRYYSGSMPARMQSTDDDGDAEVDEMIEPEMITTSHMRYVDGRCSCCPYGYHVDLDFLHHLSNEARFPNLKPINRIDRDLQKSMELYRPQDEYDDQLGPGYSSDNCVTTTRVIEEYDRTITTHIDLLTPTPRDGRSTDREVYLSDTNGGRYIENKQYPGYYDSESSPISSTGPSSPGYNETRTYEAMATLPLLPRQQHLHELQQQLQQIQPVDQLDGPQRTYVTSFDQPGQSRSFETNGRSTVDQVNLTMTKTFYERDGISVNPLNSKTDHQSDSGSIDQYGGKSVDHTNQTQTINVERTSLKLHPVKLFDQSDKQAEQSSSKTFLTSLEYESRSADRDPAVKFNGHVIPTGSGSDDVDATTRSIQTRRLFELEEEVKIIPDLQSRLAALMEEKRLLELQLRSRKLNLKDASVGDFNINEPIYFDPKYPNGRPNDNSFSPDSSLTSGNELCSFSGNKMPVRVHEKELNTEETTEIREKEVKTIFLSGGGNIDAPDFGQNRMPVGIAPSEPLGRKKPETRNIGIGEGNVFDGSSSLEVHEKELRTVYIGGAGNAAKSTRNVGILCKAAMRDVGMVHKSDDERPLTRNIAVGAGEIGVSEAELDYVGGGGGGSQSEETYFASQGFYQATSFSGLRGLNLNSEQLRAILDQMLKRTVHSVGIQCQFSTEHKSVDATHSGYELVSVGCSADTIDVDVVPIRQMRSVAIDNRPSLFHRCVGTETVYKIDIGTNTQTQGNRSNRATNTDRLVTFPASTNTETPRKPNVATETEFSIFVSTNQLCSREMNTDDVELINKRTNTELIGEVEKPLRSRATSVDSQTFESESTENRSIDFHLTPPEVAINYPSVIQTKEVTIKGRTSAGGLSGLIASAGGLTSPTRGSNRDGDLTSPSGSRRESQSRMATTVTSESAGGLSLSARGSNRDGDQSRTATTFTSESAGGLTSSARGSNRDGDLTSPTSSRQESQSRTTTTIISGSTGGSTSSARGSNRDGDLTSPTSSRQESQSRTTITSENTTPSYQLEEFHQKQDSEDDLEQLSLGNAGFSGSLLEQAGQLHGGGTSSSRDGSTRVVHTVERRVGGSSRAYPDEGSRVVHTVERRVGGGLSHTHPDSRSYEIIESGETSGLGAGFGEGRRRTYGRTRKVETRKPETVSSRGGGGVSSNVMVSGGISGGAGGSSSSYGVSGGSMSGGGSSSQSTSLDQFMSGFGRSSLLSERLGGGRIEIGEGGSGRTVITESFSPGISKTTVTEKIGHGNEKTVVTETRIERQSGGEIIQSGSSSGIIQSSSGGGNIQSGSGGGNIQSGSGGGIIQSSSGGGIIQSGSGGGIIQSTSGGGIIQSGSSSSSMSGVKFSDQSDKFDEHLSFSTSGISGNRFNAGEDFTLACNRYVQWLKDSTKINTRQLNESTTIIQKSWFMISSQKTSTSTQVEDFLSFIKSLSCNSALEKIVNMTDANGNTALHYAISHSNADIVGLLLDTGACDVNKQNTAGYTPIMLATLTNIQNDRQRTVVRRLLQSGDLNTKAVEAGQTALMLAVGHGKLETVQMLLDSGADVNIQDDDGSTALMCASEHGHVEIVKLLLSKPNCDVSIVDNDGSTASSIAKETGHTEVASLIEVKMSERN